jgi:hypothetical protein
MRAAAAGIPASSCRPAPRPSRRRHSPEDAPQHFTWVAGFPAADSPASSTLTRELVKWQPTHAGLIDDLDPGHYVDNPSA